MEAAMEVATGLEVVVAVELEVAMATGITAMEEVLAEVVVANAPT